MAVNKDMFHAQTTPSNQLFNTACEVLDGVSKLKERMLVCWWCIRPKETTKCRLKFSRKKGLQGEGATRTSSEDR